MSNQSTKDFKSKYAPLNCKDDAMMINESVRPDYVSIDRSVFFKSADERKLIKSLSRQCDKVYDNFHATPIKYVDVKLHLVNSCGSKNFKTTVKDRLPMYVINSIKLTKTYRTSELDDKGRYTKVEYQVSHLFINNKLVPLC